MRAACTSPGSRSAPLVLSLAHDRRAAVLLARRRALRGLLRARPREGVGPTGGGRLHVGDGRRRAAPGGDRGARGAGAAAPAHRGPSGGAARERSRPGDRPAEAVRQRREVVLSRWRSRTRARSACAGSARSPAAPTGRRSRGARAPCTSTSRCASRSSARSRCPPRRRRAPTRRHGRTERPTSGARCPPRPPRASIRRPSPSCVGGARRGVVVAGRDERAPGVAAAAAALAEPRALAAARRSALRGAPRAGPRSPTTTRSCARRERPAGSEPDLVLRVGDLPVSKPLRAWLARLHDVAAGGSRPRGRLAGPLVVAVSTRFALDPAAALGALAGGGVGAGEPARPPASSPRTPTGSAPGAPPTSARRRRSSACSRRRA